jgi:hypothetical protein
MYSRAFQIKLKLKMLLRNFLSSLSSTTSRVNRSSTLLSVVSSRSFSLSPYGTEVPPPSSADSWTRFTQSEL